MSNRNRRAFSILAVSALTLVLAVIHGAWGLGFLKGLSPAENPRLR